MATTKITDLTAYTDPVSTDVLPIVDVTSDVTKKVSIANVMKNASLGTAAAPAISFDGDPNTGIYSPGADQLALSTGGAGRIFIDSTGRLGVGTSSPGYALDIVGSPGVGLQIFESTSPNTRRLRITQESAGVTYDATYGTGDNTHRWLTGGTERLRIDSSGNVGIGTSSPGAPIEVAAANSAGASTVARLRHDNGADQHYFDITVNADTDTVKLISSGSTNGSIILGTAAVDTLVTTNSGRVGIGTSSPGAILHTVNTSAGAATVGAFIQNSSLTAGTEVRLGFAPNTNVVSDNRYSWIGAVNTSGSNESSLTFATAPGGAPATERVRIDSSGRLLVGTSSARANVYYTTVATTPSVQFEGVGSVYNGLSLISYSASGYSPVLTLGLSASNTQGTNTAVGNSFELGTINFTGNDGTNFRTGASIVATNDQLSAWAVGDCPTRLVFSTTADGAASPTERMRIDNGGSTSLFSSNNIGLDVSSSLAAGTTGYVLRGRYGASANTGGTTSFQVFTNGNVQNTNNSYAAISDLKLKENIVDAGSQWDDLKALQVRKYNFKEGQTHTQIGLVAQEVELVSPGLVTESPDRDSEGNALGTVTKSVNYSVLYMKAVKALQEAMERIETLEAKVAALEAA